MAPDLKRAIPVTVKRAARGLRPAMRRPYSACYAPSVQMYFQPDGDVRACCRNMNYPLGNVGEQRLHDIWQSARRQELISRLAVDDYGHGCQGCEWEIQTEGREGSYPEEFVHRAGHLTHKAASGEWPRMFEFNLSNKCNLQCIQCNGDLSSSIRIHREGRPALVSPYGDDFFEDLELFLPHLTTAQFAGGEPFLGSENYRVWDLIADLRPDLECQVVTNATQWNKRVERVLERVRIGPTFSLDGITRDTYESIRIDSDYDVVMTNIDRFCEYADRVGTDVFINFCLMAQNYHEFGDLLIFAEARNITVNVSVVHYPANCSIARLDPAEIARIHRSMVADSDRVLGQLTRHGDVWQREVDRIGSWFDDAEAPEATDHQKLWSEGPGPFGFDRFAKGHLDDRAAREELEAFAADGTVYELSLGVKELVTDCTPSAAAALGVQPDALIGRPLSAVLELAEQLHGPVSDQQMLNDVGDQVDALTVFGDVAIRTAIVAQRDTTGYVDSARMLFAKQPVGASS